MAELSESVRDLVRIEADRMRVRFDRFDLDAYGLFLRCKKLPESQVIYHDDFTWTIDAPARYASMLGVAAPGFDIGDLPFHESMFEDQREIVPQALAIKRYACWSDCGLGKTLIGLEYSRQVAHRTGQRVLIVTLNEVVNQWIEESKRFYGDSLPILRLKSRDAMREWAQHGDGKHQVAITNYEKFNPEGIDQQIVSEIKHLAGIVLDESSRLKAGGGKQKWAIIKSCRGLEYKLSLTATPAPNDVMEFASQASFLEKLRDEAEIIWTFFRRDEKTHRWTVKPHAREAFFRFMAGWSIYLRDPKKYGWRLQTPEVPQPDEFVYELPITDEQREAWLDASVEPSGQKMMFVQRETNAIQRMKLSQIAKGFMYVRAPKSKRNKKGGETIKLHEGEYREVVSPKPAFVADLIRDEQAAGHQVLVWTVFDAECEILSKLLAGLGVDHLTLTGTTKRADRLKGIEKFRQGKVPVMVTRPQILGWGMNFQFVSSMVFSGWSDSYEQYYQAVRRSFRFGQKKKLRVHVPLIRELEGEQWENLLRKQAQHEAAIEEMERNYLKARAEIN